MAEIRYTDFDLLVERSGEDTYRVRVLYSPAGMAVRDVTLPFSAMELENFLLKIGRTRRGVRRLDSPEMDAAKVFGRKLFEAIFQDEIMSALRSSLEEARKQNQGLRLRLRLNSAPELLNLPWEYLYNPALNRFLSLSVSTPVVRYLELPERILPLEIEPPLKMLVMISSPSGFPELDVEREWNNLTTAVDDLVQRGLLIVERLEVATTTELQTRLRREKYHIFHFIGHGTYNETAQDGMLLLEDESGRGRPLSGQYLGTLLHDETSLRLVVLNACEGGRTGVSDPFSGVAQSLVQQGIPAVIAMQFEVSDMAAIVFAREFYTAIADSYPVDAALAEARKAIFSLGNDVEWGTPVLYMRAADGVIFDVSNVPETVQKPPVKVDSKTPQAVEPQPQMELERVYQEALSASQGQDWEEAWNLYRRIIAIDPQYKDVEIKLDQARTQVLLAKLYDQAEQSLRGGQWKEAVSKIKQIHAVDPDYSDPKGLLARAQKNAEEAERQDRMQMLYGQAHEAIQARSWQKAIELLVQVKAIKSGYRETERLLELSRTELKKEQANAREQTPASAPIPITPPASARIVEAGSFPVSFGTQAPAGDKPRNRWLLFGLGGSGLVLLAIAVLFLIGILPPSVPPTPPLPPEPAALDGIYRVQSVADGLFWNMDGGVGGDNLLSTRNQPNDIFTNMFSFESQEDGSYRIQVVATGLYLHEDGLGTLFVNQIDDVDDYTRFYLEDRGAGVYRIRVKASDRYLHYNGPDDKLITTRYQEDSKWTWFRLVAAGGDGGVGGVPDITNTPTPTSTSTRTPTPTSTPTLTLMPELNLTYRVQCVADGLFWNAGGVGGDNLLSTRDLPNVNFTDMFIFESQEDGSYRINVVGTGLYLHEEGLETLFVNQTDDVDDYTRFYFEPQGDGVYRIRVKASDRYLHYNGPDDKLITTRYQEDSKWTWFRLVSAGE